MNYVEVAIPFFILAMGLEYVYGLMRRRQTYRLNDTVNSLSLGVLSRLVDVLKLSFSALVFGGLVTALGVQQWSMDAAWQWVLAFIAYDACYYWKHRFGHESRLFWASHVAHHQSEEFNLSTALRQTGTDYIGFIFYIPLYLAGVPPVAVITVGSLNLIYQFWVHTEHIRRLGPLEWIFVTPSNHRVHHARNPRYLDKNYGGVFIIWDRLFGSFQEELKEEPCIYGTVVPLASWNPLWANVHVWFEMVRLSFRTRRWRDKILVWFKRPGWYPSDIDNTAQSHNYQNANFPTNALPSKFNPATSTVIKIYAFINFWLITAASLWLLDVYNDMPRLLVLALFVWMSYSLYVFGYALEGRQYWWRLEWSRLGAIGGLVVACHWWWPDYGKSWGNAMVAYGAFSLVMLLLIYWFAPSSHENIAQSA